MGGFECWEEGFFWGTVPVPEPSPDFSRVTRLTRLWGLEIQIFKSNFYTSRNHIIQKDMFPSSIKWWNFWTAKLYSNVYLNCDSHTVNKYNLFSSEYRLIPKQALEFLQLMQTFPICRAASNKKKKNGDRVPIMLWALNQLRDRQDSASITELVCVRLFLLHMLSWACVDTPNYPVER